MLTRDVLNRFRTNSDYWRKRFHSVMGKVGLQAAKPTKKWFLKVLIALSAAFLFGGVSSKVNSFFVSAFFNSALHSLSKI